MNPQETMKQEPIRDPPTQRHHSTRAYPTRSPYNALVGPCEASRWLIESGGEANHETRIAASYLNCG